MESDKKNKVTYTKETLIKKIAEESNNSVRAVRAMYNSLEADVFEALSLANEDTDVSVRLFEGISIGSVFVPETTKVNNLTGKTMVTSPKIKPKASITRNYCEKLTDCIR